jgi:hypothetical protein
VTRVAIGRPADRNGAPTASLPLFQAKNGTRIVQTLLSKIHLDHIPSGDGPPMSLMTSVGYGKLRRLPQVSSRSS